MVKKIDISVLWHIYKRKRSKCLLYKTILELFLPFAWRPCHKEAIHQILQLYVLHFWRNQPFYFCTSKKGLSAFFVRLDLNHSHFFMKTNIHKPSTKFYIHMSNTFREITLYVFCKSKKGSSAFFIIINLSHSCFFPKEFHMRKLYT